MMFSNGNRIVLSSHIVALWSPHWGLVSDAYLIYLSVVSYWTEDLERWFTCRDPTSNLVLRG